MLNMLLNRDLIEGVDISELVGKRKDCGRRGSKEMVFAMEGQTQGFKVRVGVGQGAEESGL